MHHLRFMIGAEPFPSRGIAGAPIIARPHYGRDCRVPARRIFQRVLKELSPVVKQILAMVRRVHHEGRAARLGRLRDHSIDESEGFGHGVVVGADEIRQCGIIWEFRKLRAVGLESSRCGVIAIAVRKVCAVGMHHDQFLGRVLREHPSERWQKAFSIGPFYCQEHVGVRVRPRNTSFLDGKPIGVKSSLPRKRFANAAASLIDPKCTARHFARDEQRDRRMRAAGSGRHIAIDDRVLMTDADLLLAAACAEPVGTHCFPDDEDVCFVLRVKVRQPRGAPTRGRRPRVDGHA